MKTKTKALGLVMAAVLLVTATIFGTIAYLTSTDEVVNTFTVGSVAIELDEAPVDVDGQTTTGDRVKANSYKLMPGHEYDKDPIVHFQPNSEASWLFVEIKNDISAIESTETDYKSIATQITENGWTALDGVSGVYYKSVDANTGTNAIDYPVFQGFTISGTVDGDRLDDYVTTYDKDNKPVTNFINITAYAVQADGFTNVSDAWTTGLGK